MIGGESFDIRVLNHPLTLFSMNRNGFLSMMMVNGTPSVRESNGITEVTSYEIGDLRQKIGKEAGLPADWIEELKGNDEASLKAHAEALRKKLGIKQDAGKPVPPGTPGQPLTENEELNAALRLLAGVGSPNTR